MFSHGDSTGPMNLVRPFLYFYKDLNIIYVPTGTQLVFLLIKYSNLVLKDLNLVYIYKETQLVYSSYVFMMIPS